MEKINKIYYRENVTFDSEVLDIMTNKDFYYAYKRSMDVYGEPTTSFSFFQNEKKTPLEELIIKYTRPFYDKQIEKFMKRANLYHNGTYSYYFWWQVYDPEVENSRHPAHDHYRCGENNEISFVHFLKTNGDKCFRFISDNKNGYEYVDEEDNDLIFFPSWVIHDVVQPESGVRAVIAGNISITSHEAW